MAELISREELRKMSLEDLKKYAKKLKKAGYPVVADYKSITSKKALREKIREAQSEASSGSEEKEEKEEVKPKKKRATSPKAASPKPKTPKAPTAKRIKKVIPKTGRMAELMALKKPELVELSKQYKLPHSGKNKDVLSEQIMKHEEGGGVVKKTPPASPKAASPKKVSSKKSPPASPKAVSPKAVSPKAVSPKAVSPKAVSPKKKSKSSRSCGSYDYEELITKRLEELKAILKEKGITNEPGSVEEAADYICSAEKFGSCDVVGDFNCPSGSVCEIMNVEDGSGLCVDKDKAKEKPGKLEYQGKLIVGSGDAIEALRRKLGISSKGGEKELKPENEEERQKLIKTAVQVSGKDEGTFTGWNRGKLKMFIARYPIYEQRSKKVLLSELATLTGKPISKYESLSVEELQKKVGKKQKKKADKYEPPEMAVGIMSREDAEKLTKEQLAEFIVGQSPRHTSTKHLIKKKNKDDLVNLALEVAGVQEEVAPPSQEEAEESKDEAETIQEMDEESEKEVVLPPSDEETEAVKTPKKSKSSKKSKSKSKSEESEPEKEINVVDVEQALADVMAGKPSQIQNLTQAQNAVLKCLGLMA